MKMRLAVVLLAPILAGCVGQQEVVFVTNTNVGINFDTKPPVLGIGYDREEGYIGPVHANGALPPVIAKLESNLSVLAPKIEQTYATGKAAVNLTHPEDEPVRYPMTGNTKRVAYALTSATLGFKIAFAPTGPIPESMHLGYKRKEVSLIPLATNESGGCQTDASGTEQKPQVCYGSVLAQIKLDNSNGAIGDTSIKLQQLFATGVAAENLAASDKATRETFGAELNIAVEASCDANCRKIRAHMRAEKANAEVVKQKCLKDSGAKLPSQFYFWDSFAQARASCTATLKL